MLPPLMFVLLAVQPAVCTPHTRTPAPPLTAASPASCAPVAVVVNDNPYTGEMPSVPRGHTPSKPSPSFDGAVCAQFQPSFYSPDKLDAKPMTIMITKPIPKAHSNSIISPLSFQCTQGGVRSGCASMIACNRLRISSTDSTASTNACCIRTASSRRTDRAHSMTALLTRYTCTHSSANVRVSTWIIAMLRLLYLP